MFDEIHLSFYAQLLTISCHEVDPDIMLSAFFVDFCGVHFAEVGLDASSTKNGLEKKKVSRFLPFSDGR